MSDRPVQFYTAQEVARMLRVSKSTIYNLLQENRIRHIRVGKAVRIPADALDEYLRQAQQGVKIQ